MRWVIMFNECYFALRCKSCDCTECVVSPLQGVAYDRDSVLGLPRNGVTDVHRDAGLMENLYTVTVVASEHDCGLPHGASATDVFDCLLSGEVALQRRVVVDSLVGELSECDGSLGRA